MKDTMIKKADAIIAPIGFTAPAWVSEATTWLGLVIALFTAGLYAIKFTDAYYQWRHDRWKRRKMEEKDINDNKKD